MQQVGNHPESPSPVAGDVFNSRCGAFEPWPGVGAICEPEVLRHLPPVVDLRTGEGIGLRIAEAARDRILVEILELRGDLADDPGLPGRREARKRQPVAHVRFPVTHRPSS